MNSSSNDPKKNHERLYIQIASFSLIGIGIVLFVLNIIFGWKINLALPLLFLILGGGFFIIQNQLCKVWRKAAYLYIPGFLMITFGLIFLLNVITKDWNAWAYAWLLLLMAIGIGLLMVNRDLYNNASLRIISWGMIIAGISFFAIFGAVAGGLFIQVISPLLLVAVGIAVIKIKPELLFKRKHSASSANISQDQKSNQYMVEPLSSRELEVLRCINEGLSNQQIAYNLSVAPSTVKTHINNIYGKLNVENRVQALNRANELRLLDS